MISKKDIKNKKIFHFKTIKNTFNLINLYINGKIQINIQSNIEINIKIKNKKLENLEFINNDIMYITVFKDNKKCTVSCNNFKKKNIIECINQIKNTIKFISKDKNYNLTNINIFKKKQQKNIGLFFNDNISIEDMIKLAKNTEYNSINTNKKIICDYISFIYNIYFFSIYNNYKKIKFYKSKNYFLIVSLIAKEKNIMESEYNYIHTHKLSDLINKSHYLGKKTAKTAIKKLYSKKIKTKKSNIIFNNNTSTEIFSYLIKAIYGYNIYNKTSFLLKKLNKKILPKWMNIKEDPLIFKGIGTKPFDNEGNTTIQYFIVKKGILKTWILDSYFSKKLKLPNTSNCGGIHNWCFINEKNIISLDNLIKNMENGLLIDRILGNGVNISSGLFSIGASGFLIKNGNIKHSVNEITLSGNLNDLFKNIKYMSNDINLYSNIRTGSILVPNIQIGGE